MLECVILVYFGGLDILVVISWIGKEIGCEVVVVVIDFG